MSKTLQDTGKYSVKETGEVITYKFEYIVYDDSDSLVEILKLANRQAKVDGNNTTREKVKAENGHSARAVLTEEQKLENKAKRHADKALLEKIKSLDAEMLAGLGLA